MDIYNSVKLQTTLYIIIMNSLKEVITISLPLIRWVKF